MTPRGARQEAGNIDCRQVHRSVAKEFKSELIETGMHQTYSHRPSCYTAKVCLVNSMGTKKNLGIAVLPIHGHGSPGSVDMQCLR